MAEEAVSTSLAPQDRPRSGSSWGGARWPASTSAIGCGRPAALPSASAIMRMAEAVSAHHDGRTPSAVGDFYTVALTQRRVGRQAPETRAVQFVAGRLHASPMERARPLKREEQAMKPTG